jgi:hypothetical protein
MNRIERRVRNLINPYSTAFARWWCHAGRYMRIAQVIPGNGPGARPRPAPSGANPRAPFAARSFRSSPEAWLSTQAARRAAVDQVLANSDDGRGKASDQG